MNSSDNKYFQLFSMNTDNIPLPVKLNNPFNAVIPEIAKIAAKEVQHHLENFPPDHDFGLRSDTGLGKMFGVLVGKDVSGRLGYLAAFSGKLDCGTMTDFFVPPVFDTFKEGGFYKTKEEDINRINTKIHTLENDINLRQSYEKLNHAKTAFESQLLSLKEQLKKDKEKRASLRFYYNSTAHTSKETEELKIALDHESARQHFEYKDFKKKWTITLDSLQKKVKEHTSELELLKKLRKIKSGELQQFLFEKYSFYNFLGEKNNLHQLFLTSPASTPPSGAGECAAPKLFQYAYLNNIQPVAIAEFWWGISPASEVRRHKTFYTACKSKCLPILGFMLQGIHTDDKEEQTLITLGGGIPVLFEDEHIVIVDKPQPFLSVPGKSIKNSVLELLRKKYPEATGPLLVHRLDMSTSGIMLAAKSKEVHKQLQQQFENRTIKKKYIAQLDGELWVSQGMIELPIRVNLDDRPRQLVCFEHGKKAITIWKVLHVENGKTRVEFTPVTGRTHQLRVHSAHISGLNMPITGDDLYGSSSDRLYLHASQLIFKHPITGKKIHITSNPLF
ncbi:MAG: RNA pseudouridine synthase [Saprospiraceae bacterium]|nr:RNA pseudouridine synthase [Saprospiraceae bacterium]